MARQILIVDDDALLRRSLAFNLEQAGYRVRTAAGAEDGLAMIEQERPDLVLLDIGLPDMDGLDTLKQVKERFQIPVIFLTARRRELDEVVGLELGADDYVTKPFDVDVLSARIKAVLRRAEPYGVQPPEQTLIEVGDIEIDPQGQTVKVNGSFVNLSPKEFELLHAFAMEPKRVISIDDLLPRIWGAEYIGQPQVVYVHIRWLREKIEENPNRPERIITVRGRGYKFIPREKS